MQPLRIGLDFDGVIVDHHPHKRELVKSFGVELEPWQLNSNMLHRCVSDAHYRSLRESLYGQMTVAAPPVPDALETLPRLRGDLYIISARRKENEKFALDWLKNHGVLDLIPEERVIFCEEGKEKGAHCVRLGLTMFLDDKLSYLAHLPSGTRRVLFDIDGVAPRFSLSEGIRVANSWNRFLEMAEESAAEGI